MMQANDPSALVQALIAHAPFSLLGEAAQERLSTGLSQMQVAAGDLVVPRGAPLGGLYFIQTGVCDIVAPGGAVVSHRVAGDILGERGLLRDGYAVMDVRAIEPSDLITLSSELFHDFVEHEPAFAEWFTRSAPAWSDEAETGYATGLTALHVRDLMSAPPITCEADNSITDVAKVMRDRRISSLLVMQGDDLQGIVTTTDLTNKVLAEGRDGTTPVTDVMTRNPVTIRPDAVGLDAMMLLASHGISHLPVADGDELLGMVGKTNLFRQQAATASHMVLEIVGANSADEMAAVTARIPELLSQLVMAGTRPNPICRRITDITDAITRRLLALAEAEFGPPPVPYLWLACGSQGRREQTGQSDQDNCLIISDDMRPEDDAYFAKLAKFVSDGLDTCGFVYCPGDMMATATRWRQPRRVWREYFTKWIAQPDEEAQMLASVMFDLRPIAGDFALYDDLQQETLDMARGNSIFVAHMIANSLKHTPPLGLLRGFSLIKSGDHKNMVDLKHSGVVPVTDLGRVYALQGGLQAVNTRDRLEAALDAGVVSDSGARDLIDAYEMIAETRLIHQARQIRDGIKPDNFMAPSGLSDLERNHLRDAFMVIKTMQSALGHGRSA